VAKIRKTYSPDWPKTEWPKLEKHIRWIGLKLSEWPKLEKSCSPDWPNTFGMAKGGQWPTGIL